MHREEFAVILPSNFRIEILICSRVILDVLYACIEIVVTFVYLFNNCIYVLFLVSLNELRSEALPEGRGTLDLLRHQRVQTDRVGQTVSRQTGWDSRGPQRQSTFPQYSPYKHVQKC